jgi:NAD(P)-dependent dehydrogenase (short-subunit alcohol dehydrogenase family)
MRLSSGSVVSTSSSTTLQSPMSGVSATCPRPHFEETIQTNLVSHLYGERHVAAGIAERGGGSIINNGSVAGLGAMPLLAAYCTAKAGIINLTRCAAKEHRAENIRVNAVLTGFLDTTLVDNVRGEYERLAGMSMDDAISGIQGTLARDGRGRSRRRTRRLRGRQRCDRERLHRRERAERRRLLMRRPSRCQRTTLSRIVA